MRIYYVETSLSVAEKLYIPYGVKNILVSFWYEKKWENYKKFKEDNPNVSIMVDSGAFSAWSSNGEVKLDDYIEFCNKVEPYVDHIIALDVVLSGKESRQNYDIMREKLDKSEKLIPVYHTTEDYEILDYYIARSNFIAIGIYMRMRHDKRMYWNYVVNIVDRIPKDKRIHLLGVNSSKLLYMVADRIYSIDSSSMSKRGADKNRTFSMSGLQTAIQGMNKGRISHKEIDFLRVWNVLSELKLEREINDYLVNKANG